jgi:hypothetical protein
MRKLCTTLSCYRLEQHHEKERLLKRGRENVKQENLDSVLDDGCAHSAAEHGFLA